MTQRESWASSTAVRVRMQANRGRDTKPELALRRELHRRGLRYFVDRRPLPGLNRRADIVFPKLKIAIFVDGCFWHGCPEHHTTSASNTTFWSEKLERNRERDRETTARLEGAGWQVIRAWEHEDMTCVADSVVAKLTLRRAAIASQQTER